MQENWLKINLSVKENFISKDRLIACTQFVFRCPRRALSAEKRGVENSLLVSNFPNR